MKKLVFFILLFSSIYILGQVEKKSVFVPYIKKPITLDANLTELEWKKAKGADGFWNYFPTDTAQAKQQANIKFLFDDDNLYVGIRVNASNDNYIIPSLRRDFRAGGSDNITLIFDTFNDGTNAFIFGTNPYGVQREFLLSGGGSDLRGFNGAWDAKWKCKAAIKNKHYIIEMIIPLASFKYREGETKWRFNSYHFDTQDNERNTWINIPQNQFIFNLAYMGEMIFEKPLGKSKSPISLIPYINTISSKDFENNESFSDFKFGGDARLTVGNSMNLDITVNPDFSQVEVDQQVTNLTRFEISLPERRQFFIENSDLFSDFGDDRDANPFFSRRIGIATDKEDSSIGNDIIAGVRLSGKLNNDLRIGLLSMQTAEDIENEIPTLNNSVITMQQKLFSRSNISFMFINKQATKKYNFLSEEDEYNRVIGIDYNLASKDNSWTGKYYLHKSFSPIVKNNDYSAGASTQYNNRNYTFGGGVVYVADNFRSDLGFIRRTDIFRINPQIERRFWPKKGKVQNYSLSISPIFIWRPTLDFEMSDYAIFTSFETSFIDNSEFSIGMSNRLTKLYETFEPTGVENAIPLPADEKYYYTSFDASFRSDRRKSFSYEISPSYGSFYNGEKLSVEASAVLRLQPYFSGSIQVNFDKIDLPKPYSSDAIWLIGPRTDITFTKNIFWTTLVQYSTQQENFGVNTRLQWRFAPLSDLFVVYNDNYFTNPFAPRFRTLNLKLTYWLNI